MRQWRSCKARWEVQRGARALRGVARAVRGVGIADTLTIRRCSGFVMMVGASTSSQLHGLTTTISS